MRPLASIDPNEVPCVAHGTLIATDQGETLVHHLSIGERVFSPNLGFDFVEQVFQLSRSVCRGAQLKRFLANSAGNRSELVISMACKVRPQHSLTPRPNQLVTEPTEATVAGEVFENTAAIALFCVVLRTGSLMIANGGVVSAMSKRELLHVLDRPNLERPK